MISPIAKFRYRRPTGSKFHGAAQCKMKDGILTDLVLGAKLRDNPYMKRGRTLESQVVEVVERKLGMTFNSSCLMLDPSTNLFGASPDAINKDFVVEIKCLSSDKTVNNYITKKGDLKAK